MYVQVKCRVGQGSLGFELADDVLQFLRHELVVDDEGESSALLVVADGAGDKALMLLLHPDVIVDQHLHVQSVVPLLLQPLHHGFVPALLQLHLHVPFYLLYEDTGLANLLQSLLVLLHLAEYGCLVEVGGHDIVLLLIFEVPDEIFLEVDGVADCLERHHEVAVFFQDAGQVVEGEYFQLAEGAVVSEVGGGLRQHHDVDCLGDELDVAAFLLVFDVLHGQPVHLLDELPHLLLQIVLQLKGAFLEQHE